MNAEVPRPDLADRNHGRLLSLAAGCLLAGSLCFMLCRGTLLLVMTSIAFSAGVTAAADDFLLARNHVGNLIIGMPESAIYTVYPRRITKKVDLQLEGYPTPAVQVFLTKGRQRPSLLIRLEGPVPGVYGVEVMDSRFRTAKGVGVGSSLGELQKAEKQLSFVSGEGVIGALAEDLGMTFSLATDSATESRLFNGNSQDHGAELSKIPAETGITSVWVFGNPMPREPQR
jgi:hypothetical protein